MKDILIALATNMDHFNVRYCVLHGWDSLSEGLLSDLDIVITPEGLTLLEEILEKGEIGQLTQRIQYEATGYAFRLVGKVNDKTHFIAVDAITDYRVGGYIFFSGEELLSKRQRRNDFWVASTENEFSYLLVKKTFKGSVQDRQKTRLYILHNELGERAHAIIHHLFGLLLGNKVMHWLTDLDRTAIKAHFPTLRCALGWQIVKRDPLNPIRYWVSEFWRIWQRFCYPTGLLVVFLGPDGSGKSTISECVLADLAPAFLKNRYMHFRPHLGIASDNHIDPVDNPHGQEQRGWISSVAKTIYYLLDYTIGYMWKIYPLLVRSTLVIFDRYYHDLLVDPLRYRYGGPQWLTRWVGKIIPQPDLTILLDAPVEVLQTRKREVVTEEASHQREAYAKLVNDMPNGVVIDASQPLEQVVRDVNKVVLDFMATRTRERFGL